MTINQNIMKMILQGLHVTYSPDPDTKDRIESETLAGMDYIRQYCDPEADFATGTRAARLLVEYVMRAEAGAADSFQQDFAQEIVEMKTDYDVRKYAEVLGYAEA